MTGRDMLFEDALRTAIQSERKAVIYRRIIKAMAAAIAVLCGVIAWKDH